MNLITREELASLLSAYSGFTPQLPDHILAMDPDRAPDKWEATTINGGVKVAISCTTWAHLERKLEARARDEGRDIQGYLEDFTIWPPKDVLEDPDSTELRRMRRETMDRDGIHRKLDLAGMRYKLAQEAVDRARDEWHAEIRAAVAAGMMKAEVARITGLARPYIHSVIKEVEGE